MNHIETRIDDLIKNYIQIPGTDVAEFKKDLYEVIQDSAAQLLKTAKPYNSAVLSVADLENLLLLIRDLKSRYEYTTSTTVSDVLKLDEVKQWEYKITELILNNR
jgi:hypothetical protein